MFQGFRTRHFRSSDPPSMLTSWTKMNGSLEILSTGDISLEITKIPRPYVIHWDRKQEDKKNVAVYTLS
ncbi:unnamed protein product [Allacma fusca]|uniref:Uncharacterized protein n=1 Tax=Allacma fusca TaxID=39272 RepID=A0A8J2PNY4_9HEXA|nr:unnamed protein product [Allacma fusca]